MSACHDDKRNVMISMVTVSALLVGFMLTLKSESFLTKQLSRSDISTCTRTQAMRPSLTIVETRRVALRDTFVSVKRAQLVNEDSACMFYIAQYFH